MIRQLTSPERVNAAVIAFLVVVAGIAMAVLGKADPMGVQGVIVILFAGAILFLVVSSMYEPEPTDDRAMRIPGKKAVLGSPTRPVRIGEARTI